jgi:hypothetical protein
VYNTAPNNASSDRGDIVLADGTTVDLKCAKIGSSETRLQAGQWKFGSCGDRVVLCRPLHQSSTLAIFVFESGVDSSVLFTGNNMRRTLHGWFYRAESGMMSVCDAMSMHRESVLPMLKSPSEFSQVGDGVFATLWNSTLERCGQTGKVLNLAADPNLVDFKCDRFCVVIALTSSIKPYHQACDVDIDDVLDLVAVEALHSDVHDIHLFANGAAVLHCHRDQWEEALIAMIKAEDMIRTDMVAFPACAHGVGVGTPSTMFET